MKVNKILEKYNKELNEKEKYFIEYFFFKANQYLKNSSDFCVLNPNVVINLIIEELNANNNTRNLKFLKEKLGSFLKKDTILKEKYGEIIKKILEHIISDKEFTLELCKKIKSELKDAQYAKLCCRNVINLLKSNEILQHEKEEIKYLTDTLIVEFAIYGYSPNKISEILEEIFDDYEIYDNNFLSTDFPVPNRLKNEPIERKADYMNKLTIDDRFETLIKYFDKKKEKIYYVMILKGISGKNVNIRINNVHIYNYKNFPQFEFEKDNNDKIVKLWAEKFCENEIHCSVNIERIDANNSIEFVKKELNKAFDVIHIYHNVECVLEADFSNFLVFNKAKEFYGCGGSVEDSDEFKRDVNSLRYDYVDLKEMNNEYKKYNQNITNSNCEISNIIRNSARYFRKGKESKAAEDKILNYWICVENLFQVDKRFPKNILLEDDFDKKYNVISSLLPCFFSRKNISDEYWKYWEIFDNKVINYNYEDGNIKIPKGLVKKMPI